MVLGILLVIIIVSFKLKFIEDKIWRYYLWLSVSLVIGYVLFEGIILLSVILMLGSSYGLMVGVLGRIFVKNMVWVIVLIFFYGLLIWNGIKFFKRGKWSFIIFI